MDTTTRKKLIDQYKDGYRVVAEALVGATDEELATRPAPHKWNAREIVHHLADSEMTSAIRFRNLVATDNVSIVGYDQDVFAKRLHYERPITSSLKPTMRRRMMLACRSVTWIRSGGSELSRGAFDQLPYARSAISSKLPIWRPMLTRNSTS